MRVPKTMHMNFQPFNKQNILINLTNIFSFKGFKYLVRQS